MQIGIWGDSITYGEGDETGLGWVGRMRVSMVREADVEVYNRGVCSDTTRDLLKRFSTEAEAIEPSKVFFAIGINDSRYSKGSEHNEIPLAEFKENLRELIAQARAHTKDIVFIAATDVDERSIGGTTRFVNKDIARYNEALAEVARSEGLNVIPMAGVLAASGLVADGIHPTAAGYERMYERIRASIAAI